MVKNRNEHKEPIIRVARCVIWGNSYMSLRTHLVVRFLRLITGFIIKTQKKKSMKNFRLDLGKDPERDKPQNPKKNRTGMVILIIVILGIFSYIISLSSSNSQSVTTVSLPSLDNTSTTSNDPQLELLNFHCTSQYGFFEISGQVKNISGESLKDVTAVGTAYAKDGQFVNSDSVLIEYNPILSGQTSPFKVMMTNNPEMSKCNVDFKYLMGESINTKVDSSK